MDGRGGIPWRYSQRTKKSPGPNSRSETAGNKGLVKTTPGKGPYTPGGSPG